MRKTELVDIYLRAAEKIATRREMFSCCAVERTSRPAMGLYKEVMGIGNCIPYEADHTAETRRNLRVLLLCLMAEWVKSDYLEEL